MFSRLTTTILTTGISAFVGYNLITRSQHQHATIRDAAATKLQCIVRGHQSRSKECQRRKIAAASQAASQAISLFAYATTLSAYIEVAAKKKTADIEAAEKKKAVDIEFIKFERKRQHYNYVFDKALDRFTRVLKMSLHQDCTDAYIALLRIARHHQHAFRLHHMLIITNEDTDAAAPSEDWFERENIELMWSMQFNTAFPFALDDDRNELNAFDEKNVIALTISDIRAATAKLESIARRRTPVKASLAPLLEVDEEEEENNENKENKENKEKENKEEEVEQEGEEKENKCKYRSIKNPNNLKRFDLISLRFW